MSVYLAEFIGTMILMYLGSGVVAGIVLKDSKAENAGWLVIAIAWGLAVTLAIYAVGQVSGAHINPAVTLSLAFIGEFEWKMVPGYMLSQLAGAACGSALVWLHYLPHWKRTSSTEAKLAVFSTSPAVRSYAANFVSEMLGTAFLIMGLLFIGANKFTDGLNPLIVGALIVAIGLSLGGTTGWAINPARDLGPRIAHFLLPIAGKGGSDWKYSLIPVAAPLLGGLLGASLYKLIFSGEFIFMYGVIVLAAILAVVLAIRETIKQK